MIRAFYQTSENEWATRHSSQSEVATSQILLCDFHGLHSHVPWPPLEGGDGEEREHGLSDVIEVEVGFGPLPLLDGGFGGVSLQVGDERAPVTATHLLRVTNSH